jgi:hypothetical protein
LQEHFDGCVVKPLRHTELKLEIRRVMDQVNRIPRADQTAAPTVVEFSSFGPEHAAYGRDVLAELDTLLHGSWQQLLRAPSTHRVQEFANELASLANRGGAPSLRRYADELSAHARAFDVDALEAALRRYPEHVEAHRRGSRAATQTTP